MIYDLKSLNKPLILIVEDDPISALLTSSALTDIYKTHHVSSGQEALDYCQHVLPDLILMDISMPGMDGYAACRELKASLSSKDIPIIFVTGHTDIKSEDESWEAGCADFITKPFSTNTLRKRVNAHVSSKLMTDKFKRMATLDGLTNIQNRRFFDGHLTETLSVCNKTNQPLCVLLIDIDHFKQYNDVNDHLVGDDCLRLVVSTIRMKLKRSEYCLTRYSGDVFALIMPNSTLEQATELAEILRLAIKKLALPHSSSPFGEVTVSIGGALAQAPNMHETDLMKRADANLYFAKNAGRNQVLVD
ncbi:diguanylate cyclase [Aliiglaciecola litoralis]|uniref:diguanylate cyclase n=1 Tax=Aliiglaciecola litoralis TaxID=582857 RepID=A0ABN1LMF7_9ALTE